MILAQCRTEIQSFLEERQKDLEVIVMPDFFLDRLVNINWDADEFSVLISQIAERKGGSIDGVPQEDLRGGNAINLASALTALGAKVTPIICTSEYGLQQMKYHFRDAPIDFTHVKIFDKPSITTALELKTPKGKTNIMLRDLGALADFGPEFLNDNDYKLFEESEYTCLFNWAGTLKNGTQLAQAVFGSVKKKGIGKTYYDTADPIPNSKAMPELMEKVLKDNQVDILSVNENEAITYASLLDRSLNEKMKKLPFAELAMEAARILAKHLSARIDLHTSDFSATLRRKTEVKVSTFRIKPLRATGAGDAWNAGNILGDKNNLSDECRLILANAIAACYLSDPQGMHPTRSKLAKFIRNNMST